MLRVPNPPRLLLLSLARRLAPLLRLRRAKELLALRFQLGFFAFSPEALRSGLEKYWKLYRFLDTVKATTTLRQHTRCLDVGCGVPSALYLVDAQTKVGIDPLMDFLHHAPLHHRCGKEHSWLRAVGESLPFREEIFDIVLMSNVLDHVDDPLVTLKEIRRVMKRGGSLILTVDVFSAPRERDLRHPFSFKQSDVVWLLGGAGFKVGFNRLSSVYAQVFRFMKGRVTSRSDCRELVVVASPT